MKKKMLDLRKIENRNFRCFNQIPHEDLERGYKSLCNFLDAKYFTETNRTQAEHKIHMALKKKCRLEIIRSMWIGNRNVDLFIPAVKGGEIDLSSPKRKNFSGLVIEIDGKIHDAFFKMKKDLNKFEMLHCLGIGLVVIENEDIKNPTVANLVSSLKSLNRLDTRAKQRLLRNIYIHTILSHKEFVKEMAIPVTTSILKNVGEF